MKKDNENKNKTGELFESFLPDRTKDDPNENLKKEKKLYSIIFIVVCSLLLVANLIAMIINFCVSLPGGFTSLFVGFINCTISIFLIGLLIVMAHNISKMTRATLFICSKLMKDEKRYLDEQKNKAEQENNKSSVEDKAEISENKIEISDDKIEINEEATPVSVDIIVDED